MTSGPSLENFHGGGQQNQQFADKIGVATDTGMETADNCKTKENIYVNIKCIVFIVYCSAVNSAFFSVLLSVIIAGWLANQKVLVQGVADKLF